MRKLLPLFFLLLTLASCYHGKSKDHDAMADGRMVDMPEARRKAIEDSISFYSNHHYTNNFNFVVSDDSLTLYVQHPEEIINAVPTDSICIPHGDDLVVAEIRIVPVDTVDSVWVKVAHDQETFGWVHENKLLSHVTPNDPISQFISTFSDMHLLLTLVFAGIIFMAYMLYISFKKRARIVHINDIPSFYPTALVLIIALAATFYSSIQLFEPEVWKHYYYHPTLNPLSVPFQLGVFLTLVWLIPIAAIAAVDDAYRHLHVGEATLYCSGLAAICLMVYIIFSVSTLYYVGYPLLVLYIIYSIRSFYKRRRLTYYCGKCGRAMHGKGQCPYCGAMNV